MSHPVNNGWKIRTWTSATEVRQGGGVGMGFGFVCVHKGEISKADTSFGKGFEGRVSRVVAEGRRMFIIPVRNVR